MLNPTRITLARKRRGRKKTWLAARIGVSLRAISGYESGEFEPSSEMQAALAATLDFPISFFHGPDIDELPVAGASFRSLSVMTSSQRDAALAAGTLATCLGDWIESRFALPEVDVPDLRGSDPQSAADALRAHWKLGEKPISSVVHILEAHGVRVYSLPSDSLAVDAFSVWRRDIPYVFLNTKKSGERGRFDGAHELGHLTLHRHAAPSGRQAEVEADQFASAFLMPRASILATAPRVPTRNALIERKTKWAVSVMAYAHRLKTLRMLSDWNYRSLCIEMARQGDRRKEPNGIARETSKVLENVFRTLLEEGVGRASIARELNIHISELDSLVFGLTMTSIAGGRTASSSRSGPTETPRPSLRLVN